MKKSMNFYNILGIIRNSFFLWMLIRVVYVCAFAPKEIPLYYAIPLQIWSFGCPILLTCLIRMIIQKIYHKKGILNKKISTSQMIIYSLLGTIIVGLAQKVFMGSLLKVLIFGYEMILH